MSNPASSEPHGGDPLACIINHNSVDGTIVNQNCKLCTSIHRKEAERMAEEFRGNVNFSAIKAFLASKGEDIALGNVKNHINKHFFGQAEKISLAEYRENLVALSKERSDSFERIKQIVDIATLEMSRCLVMPTSGIAEEKERQRMWQDNAKIILDCEKEIHGMDDEDKKIRVVYERVHQAFALAYQKAQTDEEKRLFESVRNSFAKIHSTLENKPGG